MRTTKASQDQQLAELRTHWEGLSEADRKQLRSMVKAVMHDAGGDLTVVWERSTGETFRLSARMVLDAVTAWEAGKLYVT